MSQRNTVNRTHLPLLIQNADLPVAPQTIRLLGNLNPAAETNLNTLRQNKYR